MCASVVIVKILVAVFRVWNCRICEKIAVIRNIYQKHLGFGGLMSLQNLCGSHTNTRTIAVSITTLMCAYVTTIEISVFVYTYIREKFRSAFLVALSICMYTFSFSVRMSQFPPCFSDCLYVYERAAQFIWKVSETFELPLLKHGGCACVELVVKRAINFSWYWS